MAGGKQDVGAPRPYARILDFFGKPSSSSTELLKVLLLVLFTILS